MGGTGKTYKLFKTNSSKNRKFYQHKQNNPHANLKGFFSTKYGQPLHYLFVDFTELKKVGSKTIPGNERP